MKVAEAHKSTAAKNKVQAKQEPFFNKEGEGGFFSKSNEVTAPFFSPATVQPKLTIGEPGDKYEVEADAMADQVVQKLAAPVNSSSVNTQTQNVQKKEEDAVVQNMSEIQRKPIFESNAEQQEPNVQTKPITPFIQTKCATCEQEEKLQKKEDELTEDNIIQEKAGNSQHQPNSDLQARLASSKGNGNPLSTDTQNSMSSAFGADFSTVRIHTGSEAVQMNQDLGAQAFTNGSDIYFNQGKFDTNSDSGKHLLAHELTHTMQQGASSSNINKQSDISIQKQELQIQGNILEDDAEKVVNLLDGWTSSGDSADILRIFRKYSGSSIHSLMSILKNGSYSSTTGWNMVEWLMNDLVEEDRKALINILIEANSQDGFKFVAFEIVNEHISGYTSESDAQQIYEYFLRLNDTATAAVLNQIRIKIGGTIDSTSDYLFEDLTRLTADRLKDLFYTQGPIPANYAARFTAKKIEDLIAGYTGVSDSAAIVANFERTPSPMRGLVLYILNNLTVDRWSQTAEEALMEDMYESDYNRLIEIGVRLRPYDIEKHWLDWTWDKMVTGFDYVVGWIEYGICGVVGAAWGILDAFIQLIKVILQFVFIGIPDLIGWLMYYITDGNVGREEYNNVVRFFSGIGKLFDAPGDMISTMWGEVTAEASLIEGPFAECQRAFYWTSRIFRILVDVILIFVGGYGIVKGAISGTKIAVQMARAGKWGQLLGRIITKPGRIVAAAGGDILKLVQALSRPAKLLENSKVIIASIRMAAADQSYWQFLRKQAGIRIADERAFWQEHRTGWLTSAEAEELKILQAEQKMAQALESSVTPQEATNLIDEIDELANSANRGANSVLDDVENARPTQQPIVSPSIAARNLAGEIGIEASRLARVFSDAQMEELLNIIRGFTTNLSRDRMNALRAHITSNMEKGRSAQKITESVRRLSQMEHQELDAFLERFGLRPVTVKGWRGRTVLEDGNLDEGWIHIRARHMPPNGEADLFPLGTTRANIERITQRLVRKGTRISPLHRRMQTFEMRMKVRGKSLLIRTTVDSSDGRIITIFPVITGP